MKNSKFVSKVRSILATSLPRTQLSREGMLEAIADLNLLASGLKKTPSGKLYTRVAQELVGVCDPSSKAGRAVVSTLLYLGLSSGNSHLQSYLRGEITAKELLSKVQGSDSTRECGGSCTDCSCGAENKTADPITLSKSKLPIPPIWLARLIAEVSVPKFVRIKTISSDAISNYNLTITRHGHAIGSIRIEGDLGDEENAPELQFIAVCHAGPHIEQRFESLNEAMESILSRYLSYRGK